MPKFSDGTNFNDLHPDATGFYDDGQGNVTIYDAQNNVLPVSQADIDAEIARGQAAVTAAMYKRERANTYPSIGEQLDMLWHAIDGNETLKTQFNDFYTAVKAVKDANPRPE